MKKQLVVSLLLLFLLIGCASHGAQNTNEPVAQPKPSDSLAGKPSDDSHATEPGSEANTPSSRVVQQPKPEGPQKPDHVVIVVEENHSFEKVIGNSSMPYMNALAKQGALFTQSYGIGHPSQPNYLWLFSGSNQGVKDDSCEHQFSAANLASELMKAHYSFAGYSEDLPSAGSTVCSHLKYGRKHSPWVHFTNVPKEVNLPMDKFPADFSQLPTVSFVIPNMDHDMHDGTTQTADNWLKQHIDPYVKWAQTHNSLLIVTWDEDDFSKANHIPTIFVGPMVKPGEYDQPITHLNVLRTLEEIYRLPFVGETDKSAGIQNIWTY